MLVGCHSGTDDLTGRSRMPRKLHIVHLAPDDRVTLRQFTSAGAHPARAIRRAQILLRRPDLQVDS